MYCNAVQHAAGGSSDERRETRVLGTQASHCSIPDRCELTSTLSHVEHVWTFGLTVMPLLRREDWMLGDACFSCSACRKRMVRLGLLSKYACFKVGHPVTQLFRVGLPSNACFQPLLPGNARSKSDCW